MSASARYVAIITDGQIAELDGLLKGKEAEILEV